MMRDRGGVGRGLESLCASSKVAKLASKVAAAVCCRLDTRFVGLIRVTDWDDCAPAACIRPAVWCKSSLGRHICATAAVATQPGRVCAVLTADCLPVLFTAADGSAVAAAHAGWRGLAAGVLETTTAALSARIDGPVPVIAWLGPAISPAHFEVGDEVREAFVGPDPEMAIGFIENARGRWQCDLYTIARRILLRSGVADVFGGEHCTFAATERFFSHRRDARAGSQTGRMATLIWREP